ncbi:MAG TPA: glycosyltransferase family 2 protein [Edaphocola sp.]|nr:glycosyltransferase family 2 protein [Edaphocola sp.]
MHNKELSILIVNYNGQRYLGDCLASIERCCIGIDYEIIVFDNASEDNSVDYIKENHPYVKLIENDKNIGFSKGNNIAAKHSSARYILLLNNDTILQSDICPVIKIIEQDDTGVVGIKMLGRHFEYRKSAGNFPHPIRLFKLSLLYNTKDGLRDGYFVDDNKPIVVDWIEGSFLLTKKSIWEKVGGLDESYFMYVEDIDYCKRVAFLNKKRVYYPNCQYVHFGGYDSGRDDLLKNGLKKYIHKFKKNKVAKVVNLVSLELNFYFKYVKAGYTKKTKEFR